MESSSLLSLQVAPSLSTQVHLFSLGTLLGMPMVKVQLGNMSSLSEALIDTGASLSFLCEDFLPPGTLLDRQGRLGISGLFLADGTVVQLLGDTCVTISAFGKTVQLPFVVVCDLITLVILGCNWCSAMELRLDFMGEDYAVALNHPFRSAAGIILATVNIPSEALAPRWRNWLHKCCGGFADESGRLGQLVIHDPCNCAVENTHDK